MDMPAPNTALRLLYLESGWTMRQFAQEVNRVGTERGTPLRYREPSVHQWLAGHLPRESARPVVLEALSRRLRRPVTHAEAGFPRSSGAAHAGTVEGLIDLGSQDMDPSRRTVLGASLFSAALAVPDWPDLVGRAEAVRTGRAQRIGEPDVRVVSTFSERISELDDEFGGRYARPMAAAFLVNTVAPYLRAEAAEPVRKQMLSAASYLCYLTGYMAVDEGSHGLAQRYYVKALELAGAGEDHLAYCTTLRVMSVQAVDLGHGRTAKRLADAASAAWPEAEPRRRASLAGQRAHACAAVGDRGAAWKHLGEAEAALERADSPPRLFASYDQAALQYHLGQVHHALGDLPRAVRAMKESDRLCCSTHRRGRVKERNTLAEYQLQFGHLEAACATWHASLDEYPLVRSGRVDRQMATMVRLLRPHLGNARARELYERARGHLARPA
ncbi:transcriptional regulator [Wenjunlia vitaminophila]|uniref:Transcriptional regulator n=1 Tax=Wenjunlia vitaminophila TaxID=76728 RepID=A0A0T6LKR9_WENVI|nr:hypothetical protein [Wenjunlia vitaminophila]KRV46711.1 transcriptional regulator [Wenjunlia vitaminophila]